MLGTPKRCRSLTSLLFSAELISFAYMLTIPPSMAQSANPAPTPPAKIHERFATFLAGDGFKSVLLLENLRPDEPITVTPTLILSSLLKNSVLR